MTLDQVFTYLGWALGANLVVYTLTAVALVTLKGWMSEYHARMFAISAERAREAYVWFLSVHKLIIINFFLVPWVAVWLMR